MEAVIELVGEVIVGGLFSIIGAIFRLPFVNRRKKFLDLMKEEESSETGAIISMLPLIITAIFFIYFHE